MIKKAIFFLSITLLSCVAYSTPQDSLYSQQLFDNFSLQRRELSWMQLGFRIGYNISLTDQYSPTDEMKNLFSAEFGAFARFGKYVYAEVGIGYLFHKGHYTSNFPIPPVSNEIVETRFLQIPLKAVGYIPLKEKFAIFPAVGVLYQPLIQVSENYIGYSKKNITNHQFLFTASLGVRISYFTLEVAYRKSITPFFSDRTSGKPSYISIMAGFMF